jgi:pyridoxal 5'-phosphate synthase pdxT subunit
VSPRRPLVGVLALQGDVREHRFALERVGADTTAVRDAAALDDLDGLVIPGGESTTMYMLAARNNLLGPLRDFVATGKPVYGSCAGMIMLADEVLDGRPDQETVGGIAMTVRRNAFGRQVASFETDLVVDELGEKPFRAVFIRAPWVEQVKPEVEVLAGVGEGDDRRIVMVRQGNLLATSFHPELTDDDRVHELFVDMVNRASGQPSQEA